MKRDVASFVVSIYRSISDRGNFYSFERFFTLFDLPLYSFPSVGVNRSDRVCDGTGWLGVRRPWVCGIAGWICSSVSSREQVTFSEHVRP